MDAGRITFVGGAAPDVTKSMGFHNLDMYCVAPITMGGNQTLGTYDFWAVGTNCCSSHGADFSCAELSNPHAHSGLRLMRENDRAYFRLAVQQAEATYNIQANHPILLYWMQDPLIEINNYRSDANEYLLNGVVGFVVVELVSVVLAVFLFSRGSPL